MSNLSSPAAQPATGHPNDMPDVIDALKRLERIGSENSKTTEKIVAAAEQLSLRIAELIAGKSGDSFVVSDPTGKIKFAYTFRENEVIRGGTRITWTRATALAFAEDIANGLLDLIVETLQAQQQKDDRALRTLETGISVLKKTPDPPPFRVVPVRTRPDEH